MWALVNTATGELIARDLPEEPVPGLGEEVHGQPRGSFEWSPDARGWMQADLARLRADRWAAVKVARDRAEAWGCTTPRGRVDTDEVSQRKVVGAVTMALIAGAAGQPFAMTWTMQDNAAVEHDGPAMLAMGAAVGSHVATCHAIGLARRAEIDAAVEAAAIGAVKVEGGWPDAP